MQSQCWKAHRVDDICGISAYIRGTDHIGRHHAVVVLCAEYGCRVGICKRSSDCTVSTPCNRECRQSGREAGIRCSLDTEVDFICRVVSPGQRHSHRRIKRCSSEVIRRAVTGYRNSRSSIARASVRKRNACNRTCYGRCGSRACACRITDGDRGSRGIATASGSKRDAGNSRRCQGSSSSRACAITVNNDSRSRCITRASVRKCDAGNYAPFAATVAVAAAPVPAPVKVTVALPTGSGLVA